MVGPLTAWITAPDDHGTPLRNGHDGRLGRLQKYVEKCLKNRPKIANNINNNSDLAIKAKY